MSKKDKLINQLFIGKVSDIIGHKKTTELLQETKDAFDDYDEYAPKCTSNDKELFRLRAERSLLMDQNIGMLVKDFVKLPKVIEIDNKISELT